MLIVETEGLAVLVCTEIEEELVCDEVDVLERVAVLWLAVDVAWPVAVNASAGAVVVSISPTMKTDAMIFLMVVIIK